MFKKFLLVSLLVVMFPAMSFAQSSDVQAREALIQQLLALIAELQAQNDREVVQEVSSVTTLSAESITHESARIPGRVNGGEARDAWAVISKDAPSLSCSNRTQRVSVATDAFTTYKNGERINVTARNLDDETRYYHRSCASKSTEAIVSGAVRSFVTDEAPETTTSSDIAQLCRDAQLAGIDITTGIFGTLCFGTPIDTDPTDRGADDFDELQDELEDLIEDLAFEEDEEEREEMGEDIKDELDRFARMADANSQSIIEEIKDIVDDIVDEQDEDEREELYEEASDLIYDVDEQELPDDVEVETERATDVTETAATLNGEIEEGYTEEVWFVYSATNRALVCSGRGIGVSGTFEEGDTFARRVTGLTKDTKYYYRACAEDIEGNEESGSVEVFQTAGGGGIVVPPNKPPYTRLSLEISDDEFEVGDTLELSWSDEDEEKLEDLENWNPAVIADVIIRHTDRSKGIGQTVAEGVSISQLVRDDELNFTIKSRSNDGRVMPTGDYWLALALEYPEGYDDDVDEDGRRYIDYGVAGYATLSGLELFSDEDTIEPYVETNDATNITDSSAVLNGERESSVDVQITQTYFEYGQSPHVMRSRTPDVSRSGIDFSAKITGLDAGSAYFFRAVVVGTDGKTYKADEIEKFYTEEEDTDDIWSVDKSHKIHTVSIYEGNYPDGDRHSFWYHPEGEVDVNVVGIDKGTVLFLTSYEPVNWKFSGVGLENVKTVFMSGYYDQRATGLPSDVNVVRTSHRSGDRDYINGYSNSTKLESFIKSKTGFGSFIKERTYKADKVLITLMG